MVMSLWPRFFWPTLYIPTCCRCDIFRPSVGRLHLFDVTWVYDL